MTGCGGACNVPIAMGGGAGIGCGGSCSVVAFGGYGKKKSKNEKPNKTKKECNCKNNSKKTAAAVTMRN